MMCVVGGLLSHLGYIVAGIAIAAVVLVAVICCLTYILRRRRIAAEEARVDELENAEMTQPLAPEGQ